MFCKKCGTQMSENQKFCPKCGAAAPITVEVNYNPPVQDAPYAPAAPEAPKKKTSDTVMNVIWIVLGGWLSSLAWALEGVLWCITIIGIPLGKVCFRFAKLTIAPFGKDVIFSQSTGKVLVNIIWILITGLVNALAFGILGLVCCITIIGIPFGLQYFKFAKLSFMPFGAKIVDKATYNAMK